MVMVMVIGMVMVMVMVMVIGMVMVMVMKHTLQYILCALNIDIFNQPLIQLQK